MVKVIIELDEQEYSEFVRKVGKKTPKEIILKALGINYTHFNERRSVEIAWKLEKKARDETERRYYELLQASLANKDGIADEQKIWSPQRARKVT